MSLIKQTSIQPSDYVINLIPVISNNFNNWLNTQDDFCKNWVKATGFTAKPYSRCLLPDPDGRLSCVYLGVKSLNDIWAFADLASVLPEGKYTFTASEGFVVANAALGWALGAYTFNRYKPAVRPIAQLVLPDSDFVSLTHLIDSIYLVRDLINTPSEDMGPAELAQCMETLAKQYGAQFSQIIGEQLLQQNYPAIHTVGRSSSREPRLLDMRWGNPQHPKITLVGKGVCFDSGGLDIKTAAGMILMKKDMGGAAHALGLAQLIMAAELPVCLRVLVAAADNVIAGNAFRPGDIITTRKGLTVEVTNTDAEGRLVVCDAITQACTDNPDLLMDFTTLTGAARVALGVDVPVFFSNDQGVTQGLNEAAMCAQNPIWQLPLYAPYRDLIESPIANLVNSPNSPYAGAITAGLFLQEFVEAGIPWVHFDMMAWNLANRPGRPQGGEAMAIRGVFQYLCSKYGKKRENIVELLAIQ